MPTALTHAKTIPGQVLPWVVPPREPQEMTTKFWGVRGESRIYGDTGGRILDIPVLVYDAAQFPSRDRLSTYLDRTVNRDMMGKEATLTVGGVAGHPPFEHCSFEGCVIIDGPKLDEAGTLGGGAWALCRFIFRQHI